MWSAALQFKAGELYSFVIQCPEPEPEPPEHSRMLLYGRAIRNSVVQGLRSSAVWFLRARLVGVLEKKAYRGTGKGTLESSKWNNDEAAPTSDKDGSLVSGFIDSQSTLGQYERPSAANEKPANQNTRSYSKSEKAARAYAQRAGDWAQPTDSWPRAYLCAYKFVPHNQWRLSMVDGAEERAE